MADWIGWVATTIFAVSYFFRQARTLKLLQAVAAGLWIVYGVSIHAMPVIIANLALAGAALFSLARPRSA